MAFSFEISELGFERRVALSGRLDSYSCGRLEQTLLALFDDAGASVLIDCTALEYISSAGIRVLLMAAKKAQRENGSLTVANLQPNVQTVFDISGMTKILALFSASASALAAVPD